ncbi:riboflavin synthase [Brevibacillus fulvus]|uniref:Riboflavin synthase n=1 Tax=Brevibacillus fulvus TaxID=1125967 RepID=A0A939BWR2_9BACL|nr:riboflavin synthase [Brevibacillus fulvus]MBM7592051.1 riboflavin synthase [Brevibacillus fulvus]
MFTGLIEEVGYLEEMSGTALASKLTIRAAKVLEGVQLGDSIAVNGVCLTVVSYTTSSFTVDAMPETLRKTNLGQLKRGEPVNLERAMAIGDRFGGHIVSGHVDGTGEISRRQKFANAVLFTIKAEARLRKYMVPQGSICMDGISLTITELTDDGFSVSIIPHTLAQTSLQLKGVGDRVNLECDLIGKYVERLLSGSTRSEAKAETIGMDYLKEHGFI